MKILHIAYGHRFDDTRIYIKECTSLKKSFSEDIEYITSDKLSDLPAGYYSPKVKVIKLKSNNRYIRIIKYIYDVYKYIVESKPDICHIHDIQLLPLISLIHKKTIVIFDSHEDYPAYIADNVLKRLNIDFKKGIIRKIEMHYLRKTKCVIAATPYIKNEISKSIDNSVKIIDICNYPIVYSERKDDSCSELLSKQICFTGNAGENMGLLFVAEAIHDLPVKLVVAGRCDEIFLDKMCEIAGSDKIDYRGYVSQGEVRKIIENSMAGMVTYLPVADCLHAVPNKMYEYMERGVPIIYSDFNDWREQLDKFECGVCVDPTNVEQIKNAISEIVNMPERRNHYVNGARSAINVYNWSYEEKKLLNVYRNLEKLIV